MKLLLLITLISAALMVGTPSPVSACGKPAQGGCATVPRPPDAVLLRDTHDFGYWMTYVQRSSATPSDRQVSAELVDANIQKHLGGHLNTGVANRDVPRLLTRLHLPGFPLDFSFTLLGETRTRAVERAHLTMRGGHGPVVRLTWNRSITGWSITWVSYLGTR